MNEITTAKAQFEAALTAAGLKVKAYIPERITPPIVVIVSGSPYLTPASISAEYSLNLEIMAVAQTATNEQATEKLDELIQDVLQALPGYARLTSVGQPYIQQTNNAEYLAASLAVEIRITI